MEAVAALSEHPLATHAVGEVVGEVLEAIGTGPDLVVLLVGTSHAGALEDIVRAIETLLRPVTLVSAVAPDVLAGGRRSEDGVGIAVLAVTGADATATEPGTVGSIEVAPGVAVALDGVRAGVASVEGHRPIGGPWSVTSANGSYVHTLDDRPALECVQDVIAELDRTHRVLARRGLHLDVDGAVLRVQGGDPETNVVAVDGEVATGAVAWLAVHDDDVEDRRIAGVLADEQAVAGLLVTPRGRPRTTEAPLVPVVGITTTDPLGPTSITWFGRPGTITGASEGPG